MHRVQGMKELKFLYKMSGKRQTCCGAVGLHGGESLIRAYDRADSRNTVLFPKHLYKKCKTPKLMIRPLSKPPG